jgi:hypothetical protein
VHVSPHVQLSPQVQVALHAHVSPQVHVGEQLHGDSHVQLGERISAVVASVVEFMTSLVFGLSRE